MVRHHHGLNSVSLRYFNAAGASFDGRIGEDWTYSFNLIPLAMKAVLLDDYELKVFGDDYDTPDGTCIRDYIHVEDLADAHVKALAYLGNGGETTAVNVGTGTGSSVFDVINATAAVAQRPVAHEVVARRPGDPVSTYANPDHALEDARLDCQARSGAIVQTAYEWHLSQLDAVTERQLRKPGPLVRRFRRLDAPSSTASGQASPAAPPQHADHDATDDRPQRTDSIQHRHARSRTDEHLTQAPSRLLRRASPASAAAQSGGPTPPAGTDETREPTRQLNQGTDAA